VCEQAAQGMQWWWAESVMVHAQGAVCEQTEGLPWKAGNGMVRAQ
jgi:hypothetical protein